MTEVRRTGAVPASLWERDEEIATITRAVDILCADRSSPGTLLEARGEAGVGKTALLAETRRIAEARGCTVWSARGGETLRSVPFNVVRQLLQPALVSMLPEEARDYLGDWYDIAGPALGIADPGERQADPQNVCDGLVAAVRRLARREWPLVLMIDDAHWADQETLRWLAALAERLDETSVLVVIARRPGDVSGDSARHLEAASAMGRPLAPLNALTPDATAGLTRATLGPHADAAFCREVWAVTGGNPYETVELLAKVQDSELQPVEAEAAELRSLNRSARGSGLVARLEQLGVDATRFAWAAAILGGGITVDMVAALATLDRADAARCAELLRGARILSVPDTAGQPGADELEFVHPLIATAVYNSIPGALRTAMHGIAAQLVTDSGLGAAAASRHLLKVYPDDDQEVVAQLREAAREHLAVGAPEPPAAASNGRCRNRRCPNPTPSCCSSWAAPLSSPRPPPPSATCAPRSPCPGWTASSAWTPSSGSPRPCSTTTSWRRPSAPSRRRPPALPTPPRDCGSRPPSTCGRASTRARPPRPAAPPAWPNSPPPAPAGTTPSGPCSSCAASTP